MTSKRPRNRRGEGNQLREEILDAAHAVLSDNGDETAVTLRGVARQAGIAPQSCYLHFATRDDLLWALYEREFATLRDALESAGAPTDSPRNRLRALCSAYVTYAETQSGSYALLFSGRGAKHPEWDGRLPGEQTSTLWINTIAECVPDGTAAGPVAADLWAALHGTITLRRSLPGFPWPGDYDAVIDRLINTLVTHRTM